MKTLSYVHGVEQEIKVRTKLYFGQLWDGNGDGEELLNDRTISPDNENVVAFEVIENSNDILRILVKVTDIY